MNDKLFNEIKRNHIEIADFSNWSGILAMTLIVALLIYICIQIHLTEDKMNFSWKINTSVIIIIIAIVFLLRGVNIENQEKLEVLENNIYDNFSKMEETISIEVTDIIHSVDLGKSESKKKYCPTMKEGENCYFLEFVSPEETTQVFVPMKYETYSNVKGKLVVEIIDINRNDLTWLYDFLEWEDILIDRIEIKKNHFSFAKEIKEIK